MPIELTRREILALTAAAALFPGAALAQSDDAPVREVREMTMGDPDAPITVVEYASFTCPHCATFHRDVMPQLRENFIDTGKVNFVFREVYFDLYGLWAGVIARCAPEDRYFGIVDLIFKTQSDWTRSTATDENGAKAEVTQNLFGIGRQAGLTDDQMRECLQDREFMEALVAEFQQNMEADQVTGTPSFIINGEKASNMSYADFEARLNEELEG